MKEAAAWALGYIARHNSRQSHYASASLLLLTGCCSLGAELAQNVVDAGAVSQLVLGLQEPELSLKRISASTLSEIAKHSAEVCSCFVLKTAEVRH